MNTEIKSELKLGKKPLISLIIAVVFLALIPAFQIKFFAGSAWRGIVPSYIEDSTYYYARIQDVAKGHPFIGNPYLLEYKDEISPAFFLSDLIVALPRVVGLPFVPTVVFNIVFWSLLFTLLLYFMLRQGAVSSWLSAIISFVVYTQVYWLFVRPVVMQIVFPTFILFLFSLMFWLKKPDENKRILFFAISASFASYIYTYLLQIVGVVLVILGIYFLVKKNKNYFVSLMKVYLITFILMLPFFIYTYLQISHPLYFETMNRIGLLQTHIPRPEFYFYGRWVISTLLLGFLLYRFCPKIGRDQNYLLFFKQSVLLGSALIIVAGSNIVTGKELELSNHVGRFITLWFPMTFLVFLYFVSLNYSSFKKDLKLWQKGVIVFLILLNLVGVVRNLGRAFPFFRTTQAEVLSIQEYARPINWLKSNIKTPSVILANNEISSYITILTNQYVLFQSSAVLQLVPDVELENRYLTSRYFENLTYDQIKKDVGFYGGAGKVLNQPESFFERLDKHNQEVIRPEIAKWLNDFKVEYMIYDRLRDPQITFDAKVSGDLVYMDSRFVIFKLIY